MNYFKLSAVLIFAASWFNAVAQTKTAGYTQRPVNNYSAIITQLCPVAMHVDEYTKRAQYSMDITNVEQILPFAIGTKTTWKKVGKNDTQAKTQSIVELERLVPLLIGALQEQIMRVDSLEHELRSIKSKNTGIEKLKKFTDNRPNQ